MITVGDNVIASGCKLKTVLNDVITLKLPALEFHVNDAEVGLVHVCPMQQLSDVVAVKPGNLDTSSLSFGQSPIKPPVSTRRASSEQPPPEAPPVWQSLLKKVLVTRVLLTHSERLPFHNSNLPRN